MFIEPRHSQETRKGWIEIICGSMFSGKTEELIRRINRARIAQQHVEIFKPAVENRYHKTAVVSHNAATIPSVPVPSPHHILLMHHDAEVIGIDEAQFFGPEIIHVCQTLSEQGKRVIVAGLDMDYSGIPFGAMPQLMAIAEYVTKLHAICMVCGDLASHSFRKTANEALFMLGEKDTYEARCRHCFNTGINALKSQG